MVVSLWLYCGFLGLFCVALVGCGAAGETATDESSAGTPTQTAEAADKAITTAAGPLDLAQDREARRVSYVGKKQGATQFPGTKNNEAVFEYKLYSDNSTELDGKYMEFWSDEKGPSSAKF